MFNLGNILKEARWIGKISLLQEMQMKNMVGQLFAKYKDKFKPEEVSKEKEKFLGFANKINDEVIKNLKVDFKNEKNALIWLLEQILNNKIVESRLEEDLEIIKENLEIYFKNKGKINKVLNNITYEQLKEITKDFKKGGEEEKHEEFLSKPIYQDNNYKIYKVTEVDQCIKIGKGTSWCIQGEEYAKKYLNYGPLFLVTKSNRRFALLSFESVQFMDVQDNELSREILDKIFEVFPKEDFEVLIAKSLKRNGNIIQYIENPSEDMQLQAVKTNAFSIEFIKEPSEEVQLTAVKQNGRVIFYIKNPSEKVQLQAVKNFGPAIRHIENPSEQTKLEAIKNNPQALLHIKNISEELQLQAVKISGESINFMQDPSEKIKLEAVKNFGNSIKYIKNPSKEVQLEAVRKYFPAIKYIPNASEELQLEAVKIDSEAINFIKNPTQKVLDYVESLKI